MSAGNAWVKVLSAEMQRYPILFVHLGTAFAPIREELTACCDAVVGVEDFLTGEVPEEATTVAISDVESTVGSRRLSLSELRDRVIANVDSGKRLVLVSAISRSAFPVTIGSDLLANAKHVLFDVAADEMAAASVSELPGWDKSITPEEFLEACVLELSAETVAYLGELLWEHSLSPNESLEQILNNPATHMEALRSSGILATRNGEATWLVSTRWKQFREGVSRAGSNYLQATDWLSLAFLDLWIVERRLRNAMRIALQEKQSTNWRDSVVPNGMQAELVERARRDTQPSAEKINDLRDPLEWLTMSELFDVRDRCGLGELGLEPFMWTRLRTDLLPIRNRAAHMRIITESDARKLSTWRKIVEGRVGA